MRFSREKDESDLKRVWGQWDSFSKNMKSDAVYESFDSLENIGKRGS
jgi:hypothetical protein